MDNTEKQEAQRQRKREAQQKKRAERMAAGLCKDCGRTGDYPQNPLYCNHCGEQRREEASKRNTERKAKSAAQGRALQPPCPVRCPDCNGPCIRSGHTKTGNKIYLCKQCKFKHQGIRQRFPFPEGTETYVVALNLNQKADWGLQGYAAKHGLCLTDALRQILRTAAVEPARPMALGITKTLESGKRIFRTVHLKPDKPIPITGPFRFRDVRSETRRLHFRQTGGAKYRPNVLPVRMVALKLDGLAIAGIIKIMRVFNLNHQQAVRFILERVWRSL